MNYSAGDIVLFLIGQVVVAAAIWGGIRVELRTMHERIKDASEGLRYAHERIDTIMGWNGQERRDHENRR